VGALGAPLGLGETVTSGIVSALDRTVHGPGENGRHALLVAAVQTDAAINPGNSGGALVNCDSELIGVPTAGAALPGGNGGSIGLGFAIPVDSALQIADDLIEHGSVTHSSFGLQTLPVPGSSTAREGLFVQAIDPGGPAARAGLRPGDVITEIGGNAVTSNTDLESITQTRRPGEEVTVIYVRDGQTKKTTIRLGAGS
jgi:putative serine protease PepD